MAEQMQAALVNDALTMAIWKRKPVKGLIWHIDRGRVNMPAIVTGCYWRNMALCKA
jgi:transposase InsO family protein